MGLNQLPSKTHVTLKNCRMSIALALLVAVICVLPLPQAQGNNLLVNGSFEQYTKPPQDWYYPYQVDNNVQPGSTQITGWTVINGTIDYDAISAWPDGIAGLDLAGSPGSGGIEQIVPTTTGSNYQLTFELSGSATEIFGDPPIKTMRVTAAGQLSDFAYDTQTTTGFVTEQFAFVANSALTTLDLFCTMGSGTTTGPNIDNVILTEVPEPSGIVLAGMGLLVMSGWVLRRQESKRDMSSRQV